MTKVQKADPDLPSRSDSFLRMLELEKRYKMQRIQGHAPPTITSPSASSSSAQPNQPFKARRASGHPPLSHQTQIMKAVRRNSALPSLSISIPPSPTDAPAVGTDGLLGEPLSKTGERVKTVTFSGPEDDDGAASDHSSICQSPSWEQYTKKKQKKPKKREAEQDKKSKEKSANIFKAKGNRLSKVPPPHVQGVVSLAATDRSQSAPELERYLKSDTKILDTPNPTPPAAMVNQKANGKPKGRGFLSNFRLQHGNVAAVQKIIDNNQRDSIDGNQAPPSPMFRPHPAVTGMGPDFTNPRKPPSIRSAVSNSTRSISSLDQLPATRHSSNSSHGRSQSLLTSTFNKLKGPSYLYYRGTDEVHFQRPNSSSHVPETTPHWSNEQPTKQPIERQPESRKVQQAPPTEPSRELPEFTFPSKPKQVPVQPAANITARRVQNQARFAEPIDVNSGYESPEPTSFRSRQSQMPPPRAPNRESAVEREMRARSDRAPRASRQQLEASWNEENRASQTRQPNRTLERQYPIRQANAYVQPQVEAWEEAKHGPEISPSGPRDEANIENGNDYLRVERDEEEDRVSVGTHASTVRPHSRRQGNSPPDTNGGKHVTFPPSPDGIGTAVTSNTVNLEEPSPITESPQQEEVVVKEGVVRAEKPVRVDRSADYFSFISQAYAPPTLELRSPLEGKFPSSPRIDEEPEEEDDDLDHVARHITVRDQVHDVSSPYELSNQVTVSNTNSSGRATRQRPSKNSPSMSSHYSDSDVPAFERLGLSPKAARILAGVETSSTSTSQSHTDPSRTTSERSSSSTSDDNPPTPDSSRPQSRKGLQLSHTDAPNSINGDDATPRKFYRSPVVAPQIKQSSRTANGEVIIQDETWSRTALPIDLESQTIEAPSKPNSQTASPPLASTPTPITFAEDVKDNHSAEELININRSPYQRPIPPRAHSALELHSTTYDPTNPQNQPPLHMRKAKAGLSSISLPSSPPTEPTDIPAPRKSALRVSRRTSEDHPTPSTLVSRDGAAYLQEARKAAQLPNYPLPPPTAPSRSLRPPYSRKNSSNSAHGNAEPLAKMLVECCSCKFFHDMPSRVYECMAKPDSLVEDKLLGVSATVTTMVKCPWCAHGMSTRCCAGYAAVVYLKEKLHGK